MYFDTWAHVSGPVILWSRVFPGRPDQIAAARRFVRAVLHGRGDTALAELLASELCTNAVIHTRSGQPDGWFFLSVELLAGQCAARLRVLDLGGPRTPTYIRDDPGAAPSLDVHGRGLALVDSLSLHWDVQPGRYGRAVWCDVSLVT